ncbi:unnamed protein product [Sphagnum jensenii]|uniref:ZN622/Rei1/Reh1 zinc finger C2H2-type domain-containing protein n=1 Tax=Sphagnum jensenii TaxID=128206 RepID=A0ABP0WX63_9BRYO
MAIRQEEDDEEEEEIGGSESSEDWEEVDGETIEEVRADGDVVGPTDSELQEWDPSCCFFFDAKSADGSMEGCVKHMHKVQGFLHSRLSVPYRPTWHAQLPWPQVWLQVAQGFMCHYCDDCSKQFESMNAVHKYMEGKSHCKLHYGDDGAVEEEIAEFYDFSSSYLTSDGSQIIAMQDGMESHSLAPGGLELIVKGDGGSKTVGSREFAR